MRHDLEELRELTGSVQTGVNRAVVEDANFQMTMGRDTYGGNNLTNGDATFQQREDIEEVGRAQCDNDIDDFTRDP